MAAREAGREPVRAPRRHPHPSPDDRSTDLVYADEFGSLSADADWAAKEMFKAALRERFPDDPPNESEYVLTTGFAPPPAVG